MKKFYKLVLPLVIMIFSVSLLKAQDQVVSGKVTDATDGNPLPGVNIIEKETYNGTLTDMNGEFSIKVNQGAILVFSFVGFHPQEVEVGTQSTLNVAMIPDIQQLQEVVVIGYGQQKKEDLTGSVVAVDNKEFNKGAIVSPQELLMGRTAGVQITSQTGAPGSGATIRIRGGSSLKASNDPLIVIDGVPIDNSELSGMRNPFAIVNPNDIASMSVLKDASATAIYGSRASNGVIIITTKRGAKGEKIKLSYNGNIAVHTIPEYVDVLSGNEYREFLKGAIENGYVSTPASDLVGTESTHWQKEIFETAIGTDHNITASGAVKDIPYRASIGYTSQDGILKTSNFERTTVSVGLDPSFLKDHLKVNVNFKGMFANTQFPNESAVGAAVTFDPTKPVKVPESPWGGYYYWPQTADPSLPSTNAPSNPAAYLGLTENEAQVNRYLANAMIDYKFHFLPDLNFNVNLATDRSTTDGLEIVDAGATWERNSFEGPGKHNKYDQEKFNNLLETYLKYEKDIPSISSKIDALAGYSWQHFWKTKRDSTNNIEGTQDVPAVETKSENFLVSFYGRLNYTLLNRYLLTFTVRRDGSSRFAEGNQWGTFPSAAFAWKIKEESFLRSVDAISELKVRLGYGITGQQDISANDYPALARVNLGENTARYQFGNQFVNTLRYEAYDANLKWEETTTYNIGVDFGLINNRVTGSFDYYQRETKDLINDIPVPIGTNFSNRIVTNVGNLENKGFEIGLNAYLIENEKLTWEAGFNLTRNKNKITKLIAVDDPDYLGVLVGGIGGGVGNTVQVHTVGHPAYSFFMYEQVYDEDGNPIEGLYIDQNEDGIINDNDRIRYKNPAPDVYMGFSSRVNYKNFDFSFNARANIGNYVYNNVSSQYGNYSNVYNPEGYVNNVTSDISKTNFRNPQYLSDYYLYDASFFRMDNITLGYRVDKFFTEALNAYFNITVQNAFVITDYPGLDPEVQGTQIDSSGIDNNIYPRPRTFLLGVNLNF